MSNKAPDYIFLRGLSHGNSQRKIADRAKDDTAENEYTDETFRNRNGSGKNLPDQNNDIFPAMTGKKEPKKNKGMRKFKGSETIRKDWGGDMKHKSLVERFAEAKKKYPDLTYAQIYEETHMDMESDDADDYKEAEDLWLTNHGF